MAEQPWWQTFFDRDYIEAWSGLHPPELCEREADALWQLLALSPGMHVLDAPCGYGRLSLPLAARGARVTGVDYSTDLLAAAASYRDEQGLTEAVTFIEADLRQPLAIDGFDVAINLFSSLGYGSSKDDTDMLRTIGAALTPGGRLFVDTLHRDVVVARQARSQLAGVRLPGGGTLREELRFDPIEGLMTTTWIWNGPRGIVEKTGKVRCYTITELIALAESCDFRFVSAHQGCSTAKFESRPEDGGGRVGLVFERP